MGLKQVLCCDSCDKMIDGMKTVGYAVSGNVNLIDPLNSDGIGGGLIGNNLCNEDDYLGEAASLVDNISYFCKECFIEVLFGDGVSLITKENKLYRAMGDSIPYSPPKSHKNSF